MAPGERRKRQNAEAQRIYRAKQKERMRALEEIAGSVVASRDPSSRSAIQLPALPNFPSTRQPPPLESRSRDGSAVSSDNFDRLLHPSEARILLDFGIFFSLSRPDKVRALRIMAKEGFSLRHVIKYGLIDLGYGISPALLDNASDNPSRHWIETVSHQYQGVDLSQAATRGFHLLARLPNPPEWPSSSSSGKSVPPLYPSPSTSSTIPGTITLSVMSLLSAHLANLPHLNMTPDMLWDEDSCSQFYRRRRHGDDDDDGYQNTPPDLRPTLAQLTFPHHPYIDLVPWPAFRSRVIELASSDHPLIDEDDLCLDLANDGIRCWGSSSGMSMHGRGEGMPWDARSWEAAGWFLEKWGFLIGEGDEDGIRRNSAWWRGMKGEGGG